jgi:hypothetical protein
MSEKLTCTEALFVDPGIQNPGTNLWQRHFHVNAGYRILYSPDTGLIHISKGDGVVTSASVARCVEFKIAVPKQVKPPEFPPPPGETWTPIGGSDEGIAAKSRACSVCHKPGHNSRSCPESV